MKRLLVMPPAYNEQKDIAALFEAWLKEEKNIEALGYKVYKEAKVHDSEGMIDLVKEEINYEE